MRGSLRLHAVLMVVAGLLGALAMAPAASAAAFTSSSITAPAPESELFYNGDSGAGSVTVRGTVANPTTTATGELDCYSLNDSSVVELASGINVSSGAFALSVSLAPIAERVCRLALVPSGSSPTGSAAAPFAGPPVSVSAQFTYSTDGSEWGYDILAGRLEWSFELDSLGQCPLFASWATDPVSLGSFELFSGNACLLQSSGTAPELQTRSALQIDGLNAYAPGAIGALAKDGGGLAGEAGFEPLSYTPSYDPAHDTVSITETDIPVVCDPPGGFPPVQSSCPSLHDSGIEVQESTTVLPGAQVARVSERFIDLDNHAHTIDSLFSQSVGSPTNAGLPGFEFPGQGSFASHAAPDSFTLFPPWPSSIIVVANSTAFASTANPIGAITYNRPPSSADFISAKGAHEATFLMHYTDVVPAGGSVEYDWSFSQAADASGLALLEGPERDRFVTPAVTILRPSNRAVVRRLPVTVQGVANDLVGLTSLTLDGKPIAVGSSGVFSVPVKLRTGRNTLVVTATNVAGNVKSTSITVTYKPLPCTVPRRLAGRTLVAAETALLNNGCSVGRITRVRSPTVRKGRVISIKAVAGTHHRPGFGVGLVVSRGR